VGAEGLAALAKGRGRGGGFTLTATLVGGLSEHKQLRLLDRRPPIVVATPGRLWELLSE